MRTCIFVPPLKKASGGVIVLYQLAARLLESGREVLLAPWGRELPEGESPGQVPVVQRSDLALGPDDLWVVPEGWINALAPGISAGARCLVYVQNWAYLFTALPEGADWKRLPVDFLSVSQPVAHFVAESLGKPSRVIRPAIDPDLFHPPEEKRPAEPLCVAYMPRKNAALARQIEAVVRSRCELAGREPPRFLPIDGRSRQGVADILRLAHVFLATGYPEGCPLPPLEAMASGCLVVGFAGFGGFDYMINPKSSGLHLPGVYQPWWTARSEDERPWGPNGLFTADADVLATATLLDQALQWGPRHAVWHSMVEEGLKTAAAYGVEQQARAVGRFWERLEGDTKK